MAQPELCLANSPVLSGAFAPRLVLFQPHGSSFSYLTLLTSFLPLRLDTSSSKVLPTLRSLLAGFLLPVQSQLKHCLFRGGSSDHFTNGQSTSIPSSISTIYVFITCIIKPTLLGYFFLSFPLNYDLSQEL